MVCTVDRTECFFIVEFGFGDGHMPLVVKAIVIGAVLVFYGMILSGIAEKERGLLEKNGKIVSNLRVAERKWII